MKFCQICYDNKEPSPFGSGFYDWLDELEICPDCEQGVLIDVPMDCDEMRVLTKISGDKEFIFAMINLKQSDPIEYQLKMSQFRVQGEQLEQMERQEKEKSTPRCPHCNSTNIKAISGLNRGVSVAMWGAFSKKINKSFECKKCGYTW